MSRKYLTKLREPSLWKVSQSEENSEQYRVLVLSGVTPIHSMRLKVNPDNTGKIIVRRLNSGYRTAIEKSIKSRRMHSVSAQNVADFKEKFDDVGFWTSDTKNAFFRSGGDICLHPTLFVFESVKNSEYKMNYESVCFLTNITSELLPAFYEMAGIGSNSENWSLVDFFERQ